jgi:hypothetical protein
MEQRCYPPGAVLVRQGEPAEALFVIEDGTCQVGWQGPARLARQLARATAAGLPVGGPAAGGRPRPELVVARMDSGGGALWAPSCTTESQTWVVTVPCRWCWEAAPRRPSQTTTSRVCLRCRCTETRLLPGCRPRPSCLLAPATTRPTRTPLALNPQPAPRADAISDTSSSSAAAPSTILESPAASPRTDTAGSPAYTPRPLARDHLEQASAPALHRPHTPGRPDSPGAVQRSGASCSSPRVRKALQRSGSMHRRMKELVERAASRTNRQQRPEPAPPLHDGEQDAAPGAAAAAAAGEAPPPLPGAPRRTSSSALVSSTISSGALGGRSSCTLASGASMRRSGAQQVVGERGPGSTVGDLNFDGLVKASEVTVVAKSHVRVLAIKKADVQGVPAKMLIRAVIERHRTESIATEAVEKLAAWEDDMAEMDGWRSQVNASPGSLQVASGELLASGWMGAAGEEAHCGAWALA